MRFSSMMLAVSAASLVLAAPGLDRSKTKRASGFQWFGVNESGAEFGSGKFPGVLGTDYIWPDTSTIQTLRNAGMNIFRVPFAMERLVPNQLTGSADATYMSGLKSTVQFITSTGGYAVVDPHNYGRYYGNIITSTSDFGAFWTTLASQFVNNDHVIFDTNNEYHDMDESLVVSLNQAAINAIRGTGATSQYIFAEGNSYTGAWSWTNVNTAMSQLTDPSNKLVYEMHQYLDSDGSGTSDVCVSATIGQERVQSATQWLKSNNKRAFLGEFAAGSNDQCKQAVTGMLSYMQQNTDVWLGAEWWAAGPWWANYIYSMEPTSGIAYQNYLSVLKPYFNGNSSPASSTTTSVPTATSTTTSATSAPTAVAQHYGQCGGTGWTGPTACASPYTCKVSNAWYSQCL